MSIVSLTHSRYFHHTRHQIARSAARHLLAVHEARCCGYEVYLYTNTKRDTYVRHLCRTPREQQLLIADVNQEVATVLPNLVVTVSIHNGSLRLMIEPSITKGSVSS